MTAVALALDPGLTTGAAVGTLKDGHMLIRATQHKFDHLELWQQLELLNPDYLITEDFEFRRGRRDGLILYSLELIGVMEIWTSLKHKPLFRQSASKGKGYYSDAVLKKNEVYMPGKGHAMDATRHLLQWYTFEWGYQFNTKGFSLEPKPKGTINPKLPKRTVYR